jgi:hypothetical protein
LLRGLSIHWGYKTKALKNAGVAISPTPATMGETLLDVLKFYQQLTGEERRVPFIFGRSNQ